VMNASDLEPQHVLNTGAAAVVSLAVNSAGNLFAAGTADNIVAEWSIQKMGLVDPVASPLNDPSDVHVASSPDGEYVSASADQAHVLEWTLNDGRIPRRFNLAATASALDYSQDSRLLAAGDQAGRIYLLTSAGMSLRGNILAYDDAVDALDFSPGGTELVTASANGKISAWTVPGLKKAWEREVTGQPINSVAYSNDGRVLVTSSADGFVREFGASTGKLLYKHRIARVLIKVRSIPHSNEYAIITINDNIALWDERLRSVVNILSDDTDAVNDIAVTSDGKQLVSAGLDGKLIIWSLPAGSELASASIDKNTFGLALTPDGHTVFLADGIEIQPVTVNARAEAHELCSILGGDATAADRKTYPSLGSQPVCP
jgi:WD40 repeat protein